MTEEEKKKWALKLAVLGDPAVGKTSLITKYIENRFEKNYQPTLGVNILTKDIILEEINTEVRLILWDIAGQDKYELTRKVFFEGCHGSLLVYDISRSSTFNGIKTKWLEDFKNYARSDGVYVLIGNKVDLKESRAVSFEEGSELANIIDASDFFETSAKFGNNVQDAFKKLAIKVLKKFNV
ncbi:MAG: Rab family GTPase [Promethearchaeota archaeon]|jgi:small GTP-binding protein